jgi:hypothetical protein
MATSTTLLPLPGGGQSITTSGTSDKAVNAAPIGVREVRIKCLTADAYVRFGATGDDATTADVYMVAGDTEYFAIPHGAFVHALQVSGAGTIKTHWMVE